MPYAARLYYTIHNKNNTGLPTILLIHGAAGDHLSWPANLRRIARFPTLAVDLPGHGRSGGVALQTIEAYAAQISLLMDELLLNHTILVGHSMGGAIALTLAQEQPDRFLGMGLISAGAHLGGENIYSPLFANPHLFSENRNAFKRRLFSPAVAPGLIEKVAKPLDSVRQSILYNDWLACSRFDIRHKLKSLRLPAWLAIGTDDQIIPLSAVRYLADRLPHSSLQIIKKAGHMPQFEQPDQILLGLGSLLERIPKESHIAKKIWLNGFSPAEASN